MYKLLIKQFLRSKAVLLAFTIMILLGILSIGIGKQVLDQKQRAITNTIKHQDKHLKIQTQLHKDDLGLLLYYLKFSFINSPEPLAAISIGQSDLNSHIQNISILNLEGQKYDTDLINPMRLQVGNLDLNFLIIFLFPLVIIALTFNLLSEEIEKGTWKMITTQAKSPFRFLLLKLSIRVCFVFATVSLLFFIAKIILEITFDTDFLNMISISFLYVIFWFALCFFVILLRKRSTTNAIVLLASWLLLVVFLPVVINNYIIDKYPLEEAFTMTIKQRDAYHKKWDTDKKETLNKFYQHYPQFAKYGVKEHGFSWLWYYAMQQMGDDESKREREAMYEKIKNRAALSRKIAYFLPPLQTHLVMNDLAKTTLNHHVKFLKATTKFHENIRLEFYPKIFEGQTTNSINWKKYKPEFFKPKNRFSLKEETFSMVLMSLILVVVGVCINSRL